jgi:hypothetical protein
LGSLNKSDGKGVKFLDRPQVLIVGVLVSLAVIFVIVVLITSYLEVILDFANSLINWKAVL